MPRIDSPLTERGVEQASRVARYINAATRYADTGETDALAEFEGQGVRSRKEFHPFLTDTDSLERLALANELSFDQFYYRR